MDVSPRLIVFSDDWGRHPSSCQHLIRELLPRYRVDWINTIGTRRPSLRPHDVKRALEKFNGWLKKPKDDAPTEERLPENLTVHAPVHWPGFKNRFERSLNLVLFLRALKTLIKPEDPPTAVITTASICADLAKARPDLNWVYYCVDDLSEWPGLDGATLAALEDEMLPHVKSFVAVSEHLRERLGARGHESVLVTHGIDADHWRVERRELGEEKPVALYWGHADRRLDADVCLAVAEAMTLRMVGPRTEVDPRLLNHPRIEWHGPVDYDELPAQAARADVLVMPYADLEVTRAMQPLKLKEYLATGLPVIATALPANESWREAMDLSFDPQEFAELAWQRATSELPSAQQDARERLVSETWTAKSHAFEREISRIADTAPVESASEGLA